MDHQLFGVHVLHLRALPLLFTEFYQSTPKQVFDDSMSKSKSDVNFPEAFKVFISRTLSSWINKGVELPGLCGPYVVILLNWTPMCESPSARWDGCS